MKENMKMRKAADGGNLIVIGVAIGVLVIIGLFLFSRDMMTDTAGTQQNITSALQSGIDELKK